MDKVVTFERAHAKYQRICAAYESAYILAGGEPTPELVALAARRTAGEQYLRTHFPVEYAA